MTDCCQERIIVYMNSHKNSSVLFRIFFLECTRRGFARSHTCSAKLLCVTLSCIPRSSHQSIFFNFKYFSSFSMHTSRHTSSSADNSSKSRAFAGIKRINDFGLEFDLFLTFVGIFNIVVIFHPPCVYYCCTQYYVVLNSI